MSQAPRRYAVGRQMLVTGVSSGLRRPVWAGETLGMNRHPGLGPAGTRPSEQVVLRVPFLDHWHLPVRRASLNQADLADGSSALRHVALRPKGSSPFTFQVDVSDTEATPRWTQETSVFFPGGTEAAVQGAPDPGAWRDVGGASAWVASVSFQGSAGDGRQVPGDQAKEQAEFDKTVQLQRMVDQRSVISDEKKVALLYLDNQEEESEGQWF